MHFCTTTPISILLLFALTALCTCSNSNHGVFRFIDIPASSDDQSSPERERPNFRVGLDSNISISVQNRTKYSPTWESLDARPLPNWYDEAKVGIFIHWGVFSVPAFGSEWFWYFWRAQQQLPYVAYMKNNYAPGFTYQDFGPQFKAEFFQPDNWADLFVKSGAKYVVLTSKHHEGFTLWPSKYSFGWNAQDIGPKRDLVGQLAAAVRRTPLRFGLYHSLFEWFNPLYLADKSANFTTNDFVNFKTLRELYEIVNKYKPEVIWSDGDGEAPDVYWKSKEFLAWLYNDSPVKDTVVTNDRWGNGVNCKHGGFYTCDDRYQPGKIQNHKWENCMTLDTSSWGYRRNAPVSEYLTAQQLINTLVETVSCGGNILINVGPTKEGVIAPIMEERLLQLGSWLNVNGEAIYKTIPWSFQNDTVTKDVWYTSSSDKTKVYAFVLNWPSNGNVQLGSVNAKTVNEIRMLGYNSTLRWENADIGITVHMPPLDKVTSEWVWTAVVKIK